MKDKIIIEKNLIPYTFSILLADDLFTVGVNYNADSDFFTLSLTNASGAVVARGEKIVYDMPLFKDIFDPITFPVLTIMPCDESGEESDITWDNFGSTVFLCIDDEV